MKKKICMKNRLSVFFGGRAVVLGVAAATAFLCALTALEFAALRFEWNIPALAALSGGNGFWSEGYQREELALDESTENEMLEETKQPSEALNGEDMAQGNETPGAEPEGETEQKQEVKQEPETEAGIGTGDAAASQGESKAEESLQEDEEGRSFPYYIRINRAQNCITVYTLDSAGEYTVPYKAMICSTGLYNATPRGVYRISTKYRWRELYGNVYGQYATRIHGGILFHSVPYYKKAENTLAAEKYNKLGQQASMGCVRLTVEDAKWIAENCSEGTTVEIYDGEDPGPLGKPEAEKIDLDSPNRGWDPTDPSPDNPWN